MVRPPRNGIFIQVIIHFIPWLILLIIPLMLISREMPVSFTMIANNILTTFFGAVVFYTNFFLLVDRILYRKKILLFLFSNIVLISFLTVIVVGIANAFLRPENAMFDNVPPKMELAMIVGRNLPFFVLVSILGVAIKATGNWYQIESQKRNLELQHLESELQHLKNQLHPHFLFNSLNNIYSLIGQDPDGAQQALHRFSKLLRYVLYDSNERTVELGREVEFTRNFIELMSLRLRDVEVNQDLKTPADTMYIAPLLFIALAENAFKHGVCPGKATIINISLSVKDKNVELLVENSNCPRTQGEMIGSGIGLSNLRKRLELLYPGKHELITLVKREMHIARLKIQL